MNWRGSSPVASGQITGPKNKDDKRISFVEINAGNALRKTALDKGVAENADIAMRRPRAFAQEPRRVDAQVRVLEEPLAMLVDELDRSGEHSRLRHHDVVAKVDAITSSRDVATDEVIAAIDSISAERPAPRAQALER